MTTISADTLPDALSAPAREFISQPHRLLIGSERLDAADGRTFADARPGHRQRDRRGRPRGRRGRRARGRRRARGLRRSGPWASMPAAGRERLMHALADAIEERAEEIAQIESLDNGKPVGLAQYVDVNGAVGHLRYFAGWPTQDRGRGAAGGRAEHALLHAARAGRRVRADHPLELPAADGRLEARPGARRRLHDRAQARRADAAERAARSASSRSRSASRRAC